jgi:hypothetical protein
MSRSAAEDPVDHLFSSEPGLLRDPVQEIVKSSLRQRRVERYGQAMNRSGMLALQPNIAPPLPDNPVPEPAQA